jgi:hypothetical protein
MTDPFVHLDWRITLPEWEELKSILAANPSPFVERLVRRQGPYIVTYLGDPRVEDVIVHLNWHLAPGEWKELRTILLTELSPFIDKLIANKRI